MLFILPSRHSLHTICVLFPLHFSVWFISLYYTLFLPLFHNGGCVYWTVGLISCSSFIILSQPLLFQCSFMSSFETLMLLKLLFSPFRQRLWLTWICRFYLWLKCKYALHWIESNSVLRSSVPCRSVEKRANKEMFQSLVCTADRFRPCTLASLSFSLCLYVSLSLPLSVSCSLRSPAGRGR